MSKQENIQKYIQELEEERDSLEWKLTKNRTDFEAAREAILGEDRALRLAIRKAKEMLTDE